MILSNKKVRNKTDAEIFVVIIRRLNEEAFLTFAGNDPIFVTEDNDEAQQMLEKYFPPGAIDVLPEVPGEAEDYYEHYDEEEEEEEEEEGDEEGQEFDKDPEVPPSFVDLSMF